MTMQDHKHLWSFGKNYWSLVGMFCRNHHIVLAPSDYFLFRSLQNSSNGKNFNNDDDIESYLIQFFANKNQKFYERGIMMLIDQNGQHITE